jgi:TPR repeat protein
MKNISLVFVIALLVLGCGQPQQTDLDQAKKYMEGDSLTAPDTAKAISYFESAANGGNGEAMYYLAYYHQYGIGVEKSGEQALNWYPRSQNKMGMIYYTGSGADQDYAQALKWFTKSAKQGYDQAQYMLGKVYSLGRGVEPDTSKAIKWLKKAVKGGHPYPEFLLGKLLYETGKTDEAYEWVKKSADKGVGHAKELLEKMDS